MGKRRTDPDDDEISLQGDSTARVRTGVQAEDDGTADCGNYESAVR